MRDPDAQDADFIHWVVYNIDPRTKNTRENSKPGKELINNFHQFDYSVMSAGWFGSSVCF